MGNYYGGLGSQWLETIVEKFEYKYKDRSFENGRVGVQVIIDNQKNGMEGNELIGTMSTKRDEVFFTENVNYYDMKNAGVLANITDVLTEDMADVGESGKTILSKLDLTFRDYYNISEKYYALPFYDGFYYLVYDVDLFDNKCYYFNNQGDFINNLSEEKSVGPDGVPNTYDDGPPQTYEQFFKLMDYMVTDGITPMIWSGQYMNGYTTRFMSSLISDYAFAK